MRNVCLLLVSLLAPLSRSYAATCEPGEQSSLPVTLYPQETAMWCWAASSQMVMAYLGHNQSQCAQANNLLGRKDCPCTLCAGGAYQATQHPVPHCVQGGWPELHEYGFSYERTCNTALSWDELRQQLSTAENCRRTPVLFSWRYKGGGGHMMVAKGYLTLDGKNYVSILDPYTPGLCMGEERLILYEDYVGGSEYRHWHDFYNITYTGN